MGSITVVGMGPGSFGLMSMEAWELMQNAPQLVLRTAVHPTADELKEACSEYYHIDTDNNEKASAILMNNCGIEKVEALEDGSLRIYDGLDDIHNISKTLYENGIIPVELSRNEVNLEDYYMRMVQEA